MTESQQKAINNIKKSIPEFDFYNDSDNYEIKEWNIKELDFGGLVTVSVTTGLKNDEGTKAETYCRKHRYIFIGSRGGIQATGHYTLNGKRKDRKCKGLFDVMNRGYSN